MVVTAEIQVAVLGVSTSMSGFVAEAVRAMERAGVKYRVTPLGTAFEAESIGEVLRVCQEAHEAVAAMGVPRIVTHISIDDRREGSKGMEEKVEAVKSKL